MRTFQKFLDLVTIKQPSAVIETVQPASHDAVTMRDLMNLLVDFEVEVPGFNHSMELTMPFNRSELHRSGIFHLHYHVQFYPRDNEKLPVCTLRRMMTLTDVDLLPINVKHDEVIRQICRDINHAEELAYGTMMENGGEFA